jgi:hypothetical protein
VVVGVGGVLLCPARVDANAITITNRFDTTSSFDTRVTGTGVGFFPDVHFLVDIPGTPWESSSTIFESPGVPGPWVPDILRVNWTIQHLLGPDPGDINPNPVGPVTLSLTVVPTVAGPFGTTIGVCGTPPAMFSATAVAHMLTTGGSHFDDFCLAINGSVSADALGHLDITSYQIYYLAEHCDTLDPTAFGCAGPPVVPPGPAPEPATLLLLGPGALILACKKLKTLYRSHLPGASMSKIRGGSTTCCAAAQATARAISA